MKTISNVTSKGRSRRSPFPFITKAFAVAVAAVFCAFDLSNFRLISRSMGKFRSETSFSRLIRRNRIVNLRNAMGQWQSVEEMMLALVFRVITAPLNSID
jgi:hypothetical protein